MECWVFTFTFIFGIILTVGLSAVRADRTLSPREIPRQSFPLEGECTPELLNADRRSSSLDSFPKSLNEIRHRPPPVNIGSCFALLWPFLNCQFVVSFILPLLTISCRVQQQILLSAVECKDWREIGDCKHLRAK